MHRLMRVTILFACLCRKSDTKVICVKSIGHNTWVTNVFIGELYD